MAEPPSVFFACPGVAPKTWQVMQAMMQPATQAKVFWQPKESSLLPFAFNQLWAQALNMRQELGLTHFAMLHSDVAPASGWLDVLLRQQQRLKVDLLSVVIPIKDERGLTSTAVLVRDPNDTLQVRRFTLKELDKLPTTFRLADLKISNAETLLVNTGCWVCDFTQPWVERVAFHFQDAIVQRDNGQFEAQTFPEDWEFSVQCQALGVTVGATRAVAVAHVGAQDYRNVSVWGTWETDEGGR